MKRLLLVLSLFISSCQSSNTNSEKIKSEKISLKPWIGKSIAEVLKHPKYGMPDIKEKIGSNEIISYRQIFSADRGPEDQDIRVNLFCKRSFMFNSEDIIVEVFEEGTCRNTFDNLPIPKK